MDELSCLKPLEMKGNFPYKVKGPSTPQAPVTDENLCMQCEYCIDVCPVSAISIVDDRMFSDPATCIKCCACVKECPEGARTFDTPYTAMLHKNFSARREPELFIWFPKISVNSRFHGDSVSEPRDRLLPLSLFV